MLTNLFLGISSDGLDTKPGGSSSSFSGSQKTSLGCGLTFKALGSPIVSRVVYGFISIKVEWTEL